MGQHQSTTLTPQGSKQLCPPVLNPYAKDNATRWKQLSRQFDFVGQNPMSLKQKRSDDPKAKRKFLQPMFDVLTDYVNDNTDILTILRGLDAAVTRTNELIKDKPILARELIAPGRLGPEKEYRIKVKTAAKGGNLLRIYYLLYIDVVPMHFFREFEARYQRFFKKSDLDLEFVFVDQEEPTRKLLVDPKHRRYQRFTNMVTYHILNAYRNILYGDKAPFDHLRFCGEDIHAPITQKRLATLLAQLKTVQPQLDDEDEGIYKQADLVGYVFGTTVFPRSLKKSTVLQKINHDLKAGRYDAPKYETIKRTATKLWGFRGALRKDIYINPRDKEGEDDEEGVMEVYPIRYTSEATSAGSNTFISVNRHLNFLETAPDGSDIVKSFTLGRLMLSNILLFYNKQKDLFLPAILRGEIIDLASSYSDDVKNNLAKELIPLDNIFGTKYTSLFSVQTLIDDLHSMLFIENEFPWLDKKYEKRLVRLLFFHWLTLIEGRNVMDVKDRLDLDTHITLNNYETHGMMQTFKLRIASGGKQQSQRKNLNTFLNVCDGFRGVLQDMYTKHRTRRDMIFKQDDILNLMTLRQRINI